MSESETIEVPIKGMDCAECTLHVRKAIESLEGVNSVDVFLVSEKAIIDLDPARVDLTDIRKAVKGAGYSVPKKDQNSQESAAEGGQTFTRQVWTLLSVVFGLVLFIVVVGEWLGLFEAITQRMPWWLGLALVLAGGYPVFLEVLRAAVKRQIIAHTLMSFGVVAAILVNEWATAIVVVFFMRLGDYVERYTTERARKAVKDLSAMSPQTARIKRDGEEIEVPVSDVQIGETVIVRPGEMIPVDGEVVAGHATVNQASITGESLPVEAGPGARAFASAFVSLGSLRVCATHVGEATTFGRLIKLVEEAEAHRAQVQRLADRFSAYYLPVVLTVAVLTFLLRRDPLATAAVLVVACSCAFTLATPIAMLASIGAGAHRGLMIKGGKYLEALAHADVLLIDKTGTLTLGRPQIERIQLIDVERDDALAQLSVHDRESEVLQLAASAERYSEHPLAQAVRQAARERGLVLQDPQDFEALPGKGVRATVNGRKVEVGALRLFAGSPQLQDLEPQTGGETLLFVAVDDYIVGVLAAADTPRPEVPRAIEQVRNLGINQVEILTGDNQGAAASLLAWLETELGKKDVISCKANLLPEDKIEIVKSYQVRGHTVVMVGDGVNDAPALAQADVGIAMGGANGGAGSGVAMESAHITLMRDDWTLVPEALRIASRTMRVVRMNILFTALYNVAGLSLAALGFLPPILAAAAQSLPDLGILANSSRLLRQGGE